MRLIFIILLLLLTSTISWGQKARVETYKLVLGNYEFTAKTSFEKDTLNGNGLREYLYLFKNSQELINIPRRIDTISIYSVSDPEYRRVRFDTVDHIEVSKIVDTITKSQLNGIINSEIQIYRREQDKLTFDEAQFEVIEPSGKTSFTLDLQKAMIREGRLLFDEISALKEGGFLILHTIWFNDTENKRHEIECNIAWMIK